MKIVVVSMFFPPEMGAPAGRFYDFAQHWVSRGHDVTVITGFPNFPGGVIHEGYRGRFYQRETLDGVDVRRCWIFTMKRRGIGRALAYATYLLSSMLFALFGRYEADVVVFTSPPPIVGLTGLIAAWRKRVPLVFDIRDIWPEAIVDSGRLTNPIVIRAFEGSAQYLYRSAAKVTAVTSGWVSRLQEIGVPAEKCEVLPNGVDVAGFDEATRGALPADFDVLDSDHHWFTYAGILNTPQGLEVILEATALLQQNRPELYAKTQIVMVGEGPLGDALRAQKEEMGLDRVVFIGRQPRAAVYNLLHRSLAVYVTLRPRKDTSTVPSKIYECLASRRPVLFSAAGLGAETIREADGGLVTAPGDPKELYEAMCTYLEDPTLADAHGRSGRAFVEANFDRAKIARQFEEVLEEARRLHGGR